MRTLMIILVLPGLGWVLGMVVCGYYERRAARSLGWKATR